MSRAVLLFLCLTACGRSSVLEPFTERPEPASPAPLPSSSPSPLLGHWADFRLGNCINDEAWLSFGLDSALTVTSVDRNYCGPHSVAVARGTYVEAPQTLKLEWAPARGPHTLEMTWVVLPREKSPDWQPQGYRFGDRQLSMRVWSRSGQSFTRRWLERTEEDGKTYARSTEAEVTFDAPPLEVAEGSTVTATLKWGSRVDWGDQPPRSLNESFTLPCRVKTEGGVRQVKAVALDSYDGFWKLLTARGLDTSYGWDLDRVIHAVGPDWIIDAEGRLFQAHPGDAPAYLELQHPPPAAP